MNANDWYKDRILWKANQHSLFEKRCSRYEDVPIEQKNSMDSAQIIGCPVLAFTDAISGNWTLLTTAEIISYQDKEIWSVMLSDVKKKVVIEKGGYASPDEVKRSSEFLLVGDRRIRIWVPAGPELFALMNILRMFPLTQPQ